MNSHGVKARDCYHSTMALTLFTLNYTHLELMLGTSKLPDVTNTSSNPKNEMFKSLQCHFHLYPISWSFCCTNLNNYALLVMFNHNCTNGLLALEVFSNFYLFFTTYRILLARVLFTANFNTVWTSGGDKDLQLDQISLDRISGSLNCPEAYNLHLRVHIIMS